jgi:hypothetical protein
MRPLARLLLPWRRRLLIVVLAGLHHPVRLVVAHRIIAIGLRRIAVDERPQEHRVGDRAHLVLDREQNPVRIGIDDVAEAPLILVVLAVDEIACLEPAMGWCGSWLNPCVYFFRRRAFSTFFRLSRLSQGDSFGWEWDQMAAGHKDPVLNPQWLFCTRSLRRRMSTLAC